MEIPLIPGYIFVQLDENKRDLVFQVSGVVRYVFWLGKPAIVRNEEILILKEFMQNTRLEAKLESLKPGDVFSIPTGPFKGSEGIVKELDKNRIQLLLVGLGFKITKSIFIQGRYVLGLTEVSQKADAKNSVLQLSAGLLF